MKVLAIYNTTRIGGGEVSFTLSLELASGRGVDVLALIPGPGPLAMLLEERQIPFRIAAQPTLRSREGLLRLWIPSPEWIEPGNDFGPDLIHCNSVRSALYGQGLGRRLGVPSVFHARIATPDPLIDRFLATRSAAVVCVSETVRQRFSAFDRKTVLLPNPVDVDSYRLESSDPGLRRRWLGNGTHLVGVAGEISPVKGYDRVIECVALLRRRLPGLRLVIAGDPVDSHYSRSLRKRIRSLQLGDAVEFVGFRSDMAAVYGALDLVAVPSRSEGFGRVAVEAGAARRPILSQDLPSVGEIVPKSCESFLVDFGDTPAAADRMFYLLTARSEAARLADRFHRHVRERFQTAAHAERLVDLYDTVAGRRVIAS